MNKIIHSTKNHLERQKSKYLFLSLIIFVGFISGLLFIFFISNEDKLLLEKELTDIFGIINSGKLNYFDTLMNSLYNNILMLVFIYILAISIIGIPIIPLLLFIKGFIFGFSISSIISIYNTKGILISLSYIFPHYIISLVLFLLIGFYSMNFSIRLFRYLFLKENITLNRYFKNLNKIFIICLFFLIITSLLETYLSPILIDLCV